MTLVVSVNGPESIWLLADRRLSYADRPPKDDGLKIMHLSTTDGVAILGYAGLGATALGTEPGEWMSAVLRGRNLPLQQSLEALTGAIQRQLPKHLAKLPGKNIAAHHVIVPAFVDGEARCYSIDLVLAPDRKRGKYRIVRYTAEEQPSIPPRLLFGGSGALHLMKDETWKRSLLRLVNAYDRKKISARAVADHFAKLNNNVHLALEKTDKSVGPSCVVAWRDRTGGGAHQFYMGEGRTGDSGSLPNIATGTDMKAIAGLLMSPTLEAMKTGKPAASPFLVNQDEIDAGMANISHKPDENLPLPLEPRKRP